MEIEQQIIDLMKAYYADYYRDQLGLKDWETRVQARLSEEKNILPFVRKFELWTGNPIEAGTKILVVGGGTGAEFIFFSERGCDVYAVEPNPEAVKIAHLKAKRAGYKQENYIQGVGENLPFEDDEFDIVWCWTVLEHVQDVEKTISEMIRVVRPHGRIFIETPDYRQFSEPHYKIKIPMFLPKPLLKLWLRSKGRDPAFLDTLQLVTSRQLTNIFQNYPVYAMFIIHPWTEEWKNPRGLFMHAVKWMIQSLSIHYNQYWILQKLDEGHSEWSQ